MKIRDIRRLIDLLQDSDIQQLEYEDESVRVVLKRGVEAAPQGAAVGQPASVVTMAQPVAATGREEVRGGYEVRSPFIGTFYRAPAPDAAPFTEVGQRVQAGQTLCIVEAMKLMNEIEAEKSGVVREILVSNGTPVEYDQALFVIDPD